MSTAIWLEDTEGTLLSIVIDKTIRDESDRVRILNEIKEALESLVDLAVEVLPENEVEAAERSWIQGLMYQLDGDADPNLQDTINSIAGKVGASRKDATDGEA